MSQRLALVCVFATVATMGIPSLVVASVEPLVVVVETGPGGAVDPTEVRQIIAAELRTPARAPRDPAADETSDLLIVAVNRAEIRMSLRSRAADVVSRTVPAPRDRKARLQSIGWLAGNLARDQVNAIVAPMPLPAALYEASVEEPEVPPAAPPPATEPPPLAESPARAPTPAVAGVLAARPSSTVVGAGGAGPTWSLTVGGGPSVLWSPGVDRPQPIWPGPGVWSLEVQRRPSAGRLFFGVVLDLVPDSAQRIKSLSLDSIGGAALVGVGRHFTRTFVEATAGLGIEAYQEGVEVTMTGTPAPMVFTSSTQAFTVLELGLYLRGQATAGLTLSKSFDLLASVGGHLGTVGNWDHFLTASLGVRFRFPQ